MTRKTLRKDKGKEEQGRRRTDITKGTGAKRDRGEEGQGRRGTGAKRDRGEEGQTLREGQGRRRTNITKGTGAKRDRHYESDRGEKSLRHWRAAGLGVLSAWLSLHASYGVSVCIMPLYTLSKAAVVGGAVMVQWWCSGGVVVQWWWSGGIVVMDWWWSGGRVVVKWW